MRTLEVIHSLIAATIKYRVTVITGASSDMGKAISRDLVRKGWKVAMADIHPNTGLSEELVTGRYSSNVMLPIMTAKRRCFRKFGFDMGGLMPSVRLLESLTGAPSSSLTIEASIISL